MNLVIVGGKNPELMSKSLYDNFDDIQILTYPDTNMFLSAVSSHSLDVHRMLLLQDGIDTVSDEDVYNFVDFVQVTYPAMKIISICKDKEGITFLGDLLSGPNYAHFMPTVSKVKMIVDFASMEIPAMMKKYSNYAYIKEVNAQVEIVEEAVPQGFDETQNNQNIPGLVAKPDKPEPKKGLLGALFGTRPKKNKGVLREEELKAIGQSQVR